MLSDTVLKEICEKRREATWPGLVQGVRSAGPLNALGRELVVLTEVKERENTSLGGVMLSEQEVGTHLRPAKCHYTGLM